MKLLIDTADVNEIKKFSQYVEGVTTNPILFQKVYEYEKTWTKTRYEKFLQDTKKLQNIKKIFLEIVSERQMAGYDPTDRREVVYKIPLVSWNIELLKYMKSEAMLYKTCTTMVYDIFQLNLAFDFGVAYSIVLHAKNDNDKFLEEAVALKENYHYKTKLIAASFRTKNDVKHAMLTGADYATVPPHILEMMFSNLQAEKDYNNLYG